MSGAMTGTELALVIGAIGTLITAMASSAALLIGALNTRKLNQTSADVRKIEIATNSMKDALVAATAKSALAEGNLQGRTEQTAERKAEGKD